MIISKEKEDVSIGTQRGARNQQVARAGEYFVVAELNKRKAYAVTFAGNMPHIDVMACNQDQTRTVHIQVKTKQKGHWHTSIREGKLTEPSANPKDETFYWVFVDLGDLNSVPRYWIVPDWWMRNDIYTAHQAYLEKHGGKRPGNPDSTHHSIDEKRLAEWKDRWDVIGIFDSDVYPNQKATSHHQK